MKRLLLGVLFGCLLLLPLSVQAQAADWTIIYYSAADTDLEAFMIGDLMEMQIVGSSEAVNIVVEMDRVEGYDELNGNWTDTRRFLIQKGKQGQTSFGDFQMSRDAYIANLEALDPEEIGTTQDDINSFIDAVRGASDAEFEELLLEQAAPLVGGNSAQGMQQEAIESIGEAEMGDAAHLAEFAIWAIEKYPAERYMLIISNHGGGWTGIAFDESSGNDALSLRDLDTALADITRTTGIDKLDLVAFDACLMGQLEVYNVIAPYARYTLAAEEPIPGAGWEYVAPLQALIENPAMDIPEFGQIVIDSYMMYYSELLTSYPTYDLHLVDLEKVDAVNTALNDFIGIVSANPANYIEAIGYARSEAQGFSQDDPQAAAAFSSVDLADFMKKIQGYSDDPALADAANAVIDAVGQAVLYSRASAELPGATGLAVYFPANVDDYSIGGNNAAYPEQAGPIMAAWVGFLNVFHGTAETVYAPANTGLRIEITDVIPSDYDASIYEPPTIIFDTDGTGIVDMQFYAALVVENGISVIVDSAALESAVYTDEGEQLPPFPEGPTTNSFQWNVEVPLVTDAAGNTAVVALIANKDNPDASSVSGIYRGRDGSETEAYILFDLETQTMQSVFGIQQSAAGQALGEIKVNDGDSFEPFDLVLDDTGTINRVPSGVELFFSDTPLAYTYIPAPSGAYLLTIWMEDIAGNTVQDVAGFNINNDELDGNWRGLVDIDSGITFLYPWSWGSMTSTLHEDESYSLDLMNADGTQFITVELFDESYGVTSLDDLTNNSLAILDDIGAAAGEPESLLAGYEDYEQDAVVIPYTYTNEAGDERLGWFVLVYVADNALGYQIDIDVPAVDEAVGVELLDYVLGTLYFQQLTLDE